MVVLASVVLKVVQAQQPSHGTKGLDSESTDGWRVHNRFVHVALGGIRGRISRSGDHVPPKPLHIWIRTVLDAGRSKRYSRNCRGSEWYVWGCVQ